MVEQITFGLSLGVVSGLVTALVLWLLTIVWRTSFRPWVEDLVYNGIRIQGAWLLEDEHARDDSWGHLESLDLSQKAHRVSGTVTLIPKPDASRSAAAFSLRIKGEVRDRFAILTVHSPKRNRLSYSALLLEVAGDGSTLRGAVAYYNTEAEKINSDSVVYKRKVAD